MKIPDLTYKIVAIPSLPEAENIEEVIDWAIEMIEYGYESPTLFILAGEQTPVNYFEIKKYLLQIFKELSIPLRTEKEATILDKYFYLLEIFQGKNIQKNIYSYKTLGLPKGKNLDNLQDAWISMSGELPIYEVPGFGMVKLTEIENFIMQEAKKWIQENQIDIFHIQ